MVNIAKEIRTAALLFIAFSLLTGLAYPLFITGIVNTAIPGKAGGSLLIVDGNVVGSELLGQKFTSPGYFHGRPSAADYAANSSGASNYGPTSARLMDLVRQRVMEIRGENGMPPNEAVPADLVLASGSGLDPHISVEGAMLQVGRIARARGLSEPNVRALVNRHVEPAEIGVLGQDRVNVLKLNIGLDDLARR
ncbi:MAG TPA: potassium-transporting ATPase subunit KdpC [Methanotrichaceae archaeon]|nr:potassium-transporting ATPase subunit KdpC [Methanotrichaceae archaeon]